MFSSDTCEFGKQYHHTAELAEASGCRNPDSSLPPARCRWPVDHAIYFADVLIFVLFT
jgi:hypothetical protein